MLMHKFPNTIHTFLTFIIFIITVLILTVIRSESWQCRQVRYEWPVLVLVQQVLVQQFGVLETQWQQMVKFASCLTVSSLSVQVGHKAAALDMLCCSKCWSSWWGSEGWKKSRSTVTPLLVQVLIKATNPGNIIFIKTKNQLNISKNYCWETFLKEE